MASPTFERYEEEPDIEPYPNVELFPDVEFSARASPPTQYSNPEPDIQAQSQYSYMSILDLESPISVTEFSEEPPPCAPHDDRSIHYSRGRTFRDTWFNDFASQQEKCVTSRAGRRRKFRRIMRRWHRETSYMDHQESDTSDRQRLPQNPSPWEPEDQADDEASMGSYYDIPWPDQYEESTRCKYPSGSEPGSGQSVTTQRNDHQGKIFAAPVFYCASPNLILCSTANIEAKEAERSTATKTLVSTEEVGLKYIKLLRILSNDHDQEGPYVTFGRSKRLRCSLETFDRPTFPDYVALSYVWGTETPRNIIVVNERRKLIRQNLYNALRYFEAQGIPEYIWIDAICIDQDNDEEKSAQVQHMGEIFKRAKKVFAWLEIPDEAQVYQLEDIDAERRALLDHLEDFGSIFWEKSGAENQKLNEMSMDISKVFQLCLPALEEQFTQEGAGCFPVSAYAEFSNNPYWQRIWVLQEAYLAQDLCFLYAGKRISAQTLSGALILLARFQKYVFERLSEVTMVPTAAIPQTLLHRFAFESPSFPEMHRLIIYTSIYPTDTVSLRVAMANFCVKELPRGSRSTDPRDMIFGLLGFATPQERGYMKADYRKPVSETFRDVTRALVVHGFADVIAWSQPLEKRYQGLPSWVPDFTSTIYEPLCSQGQAKPWLPQFQAAAGKPLVLWPRLEYQEGSNSLSLLGITLDEICEVGSLWFPREDTTSCQGRMAGLHDNCECSTRMSARSASYKAILNLLNEIERFTTTIPGNATSNGAVFRVACADQLVLDSKLRRAPESLESFYSQAVQYATSFLSGESEDDVTSDARTYFETMLRWVKKRPFRTLEGYVGLGPEDAKIGDFVIILFGFSAPYVMRKAKGLGERTYRVVGESYVCGVMDGESLSGVHHVEDLFSLI